MTACRLSIALPNASAAELIDLAVRAERYNLGVWVGDPFRKSPNSDDNYVLATAAAVAASTCFVRVGIWLHLDGLTHEIRIAEDLGVIDQISNGRIDLGICQNDEDPGAWRERVIRVLGSWDGWELSDGRSPNVTPPPAQPTLPVAILADKDLADQLRTDVATFDEADPSGNRHRNILIYSPKMTAEDVSGWNAHEIVEELRSAAWRAGQAREIVLLLNRSNLRDDDLKMLGMVIAVGLRASDGDRPTLLSDAWAWYSERKEAHSMPGRELAG